MTDTRSRARGQAPTPARAGASTPPTARPARTERHHAGAILAGTVLLVAVFVLSLSVGTTALPLSDVLASLLGGSGGPADFVVRELRLPRAVAGICVGAALAVAGALTQTVTRNPLASPDIIGVTSGASLGAVAVIVFGGSAGGASGAVASVGVPAAAMAGGAIASLLVALVARAGERVVLVGVGVTAMCQSAVTWLLVSGDVTDAGRAATWLAGSLSGRVWTDVAPVVVAIVALTPATWLLTRELAVLVLGDDVATGLGANPSRTRWVALGASTVLAGLATAAAGPVAFVGLCAPALAVRIARVERPPLVLSALVGAVLVSGSDLVARNLFGWLGLGPTELPVGIVTGIIGAVYLVVLLHRRAGRST
ncbi:iron complex transport system permease protein [Knoellia remsis]|uniref:Iron complex transport system permease protein n=1 Tax=Knoellia remsis TaxID=407159 RepID=A0A2T0UU64_9MICO|nr:iron ABC transporter permease [Knoellia remsis]PRY61453.1 iron complex transport system permease protein [Knoellia remsis]